MITTNCVRTNFTNNLQFFLNIIKFLENKSIEQPLLIYSISRILKIVSFVVLTGKISPFFNPQSLPKHYAKSVNIHEQYQSIKYTYMYIHNIVQLHRRYKVQQKPGVTKPPIKLKSYRNSLKRFFV